MSKRRCYICNIKQAESGKSFHSFPKDPTIQQKWRQFCGLTETANVKYIQICSDHFNDVDFVKIAHGRGIQKLACGAVPTQRRQEERIEVRNSASDLATVQVITPIPSASTSRLENTIPLDEIEDTLIVENQPTTPPPLKKRPFFEPRFVGELSPSDFASPKRARRCVNLVKKTHDKQKSEIRNLKRRNVRLIKKITELKDLVAHLRQKQLISGDAEEFIMDSASEPMKELINRKLKKKSKAKYSPSLRAFALTLQFYSPKAYEYVRKTWQKLLPHQGPLRRWYSVVDGRPGFTSEALQAIKRRSETKPVVVNLVLDEMSIREQIIYKGDRFYGGIDLGTSLKGNTDNPVKAKYVLKNEFKRQKFNRLVLFSHE